VAGHTFVGICTYFLVEILVLIAIALRDPQDPWRGFRLAGVAFFVTASAYPFPLRVLLQSISAMAREARNWRTCSVKLGSIATTEVS
jgi:hypothetical protein